MLDTVAKEHRAWAKSNRGSKELQMLKLVEEVGELAAARIQGDQREIWDAMGDIFISWLTLCRALAISPSLVASDVWENVKARRYKGGIRANTNDQ